MLIEAEGQDFAGLIEGVSRRPIGRPKAVWTPGRCWPCWRTSPAASARRGRGGASRAVEVLGWAGRDVRISALSAETSVSNLASRGVLEKAGFKPVGARSRAERHGPMNNHGQGAQSDRNNHQGRAGMAEFVVLVDVGLKQLDH
jgi:hypothetical protein